MGNISGRSKSPYGILVLFGAYSSSALTFTYLNKYAVAFLIFTHFLEQRYARIAFRYRYSCHIKQCRRKIYKTNKPVINYTAFEHPSADNQRRMRCAVVATSLILKIAGLKMRAVIACINNNCVIVESLFLQLFNELTDIIIKSVYCSYVIRIHFIIIAG